MKVSMTDETPEFVCRGCGYHEKNCVCIAQKSIKEAVISGIVLLKNGIAKIAQKSYYHIHEDVVI